MLYIKIHLRLLKNSRSCFPLCFLTCMYKILCIKIKAAIITIVICYIIINVSNIKLIINNHY